jgi:LemA protein
MLWIVLVIVAIVVLLVLWVVGIYNRLVRTRNSVDNAWAQIEVQLKRRHDLIPNLVETVKGYAAHERGTFEAVTQARVAAQQAQGPAAAGQAEGILNQALGRLFAVAEAYPELKASQNFLDLQGQLRDTEDQIAGVRQGYNNAVLSFNNAIQTFPATLLANSFGFTKREFFEIEDAGDRAVPQVSFAPDSSAPPAAEPPSTPSDAPGTSA